MHTCTKITPKREVTEALGELSDALGECRNVLQLPEVPTEQLAICLAMMGTGVAELTKKVEANLMSTPGWTEKTLRVLSLANGDQPITIIFEGGVEALGKAPGVLLCVYEPKSGEYRPRYLGLGSTLDRALEHAISKFTNAQLVQFADKIEIGRES